MRFAVPITIHDDLTITKTSSNRSISFILNLILSLVACLFILSSIRFIRQENPIVIIQTNLSLVINDEHQTPINLTRNRGYYDYQRYLLNNTVKIENTTRRYYYIDLGCFDGRDIDYFVHFHLEEISQLGTLNIIAFEPDPINFSACKFAQEKRGSIPTTVYDAAVWTDDGRVKFATEKGQKSKIDQDSVLFVRAVDFSKWLREYIHPEDFVYVKFTIEGAEIPILEKMIFEGTITLVDNMEIEWNDGLSPDLEPRRVVLECMFDNFGMDFIYMINPVDLRHAFNVKDNFAAVPKDKGWKLKDPLIRFHYRARKEVPELLVERLQRKIEFSSLLSI